MKKFNNGEFNLQNLNQEVELYGWVLKKRNLGGKTSTLIIFLGRKDKIATNHIVCALVEETGIDSKNIGKIKVEDKYTLVDIPVEYVKETISSLSKIKIRNQKVRIEEKRK